MKRNHAAIQIRFGRPVDVPLHIDRLPRHVAFAAVSVVEEVLLWFVASEAARDVDQAEVVVCENQVWADDEETGVFVVGTAFVVDRLRED
jgi:hypothetical protein